MHGQINKCINMTNISVAGTNKWKLLQGHINCPSQFISTRPNFLTGNDVTHLAIDGVYDLPEVSFDCFSSEKHKEVFTKQGINGWMFNQKTISKRESLGHSRPKYLLNHKRLSLQNVLRQKLYLWCSLVQYITRFPCGSTGVFAEM